MIAEICSTPVYYESVGQGIPMICIHGYGVDHRSIKSGLEPVFSSAEYSESKDLDKKGFRRIYFDLPGMGRSGTHSQILGSDDMLEFVLQFIDHLLGPDQPFVLAGYSYGGYLARGVLYQMKQQAQQEQRAQRVLGLLLICPVINFRRQGRDLPEFHLCQQDKSFVESLTPEQFLCIDQFITIQTPWVWEQYQTHIHPSITLVDESLMTRIRDTEFSFLVDSCQEGCCDRPTLVLLGRYDVAVGYRDAGKIHANFSDASFVVLDRAGHLLHLEQPDLFKIHVLDWLGRIDVDVNGTL